MLKQTILAISLFLLSALIIGSGVLLQEPKKEYKIIYSKLA